MHEYLKQELIRSGVRRAYINPPLGRSSPEKAINGYFKTKDGKPASGFLGKMEVPDNPDNIGNLRYGDISAIVTSPPFQAQKTGGKQGAGKYSGTDLSQGLKRVKDDYAGAEHPDSIDCLPYGSLADCVISSPPYAEAHDKEPGGITKTNRKDLLPYSWLKEDNPANIGNLPYGSISVVLSSPPYSDAPSGGGLNTKPPRPGRKDQTGRSANSPSQKGAGRYVDHIISSPPYEGSLEASSRHTKGGIPGRDKKLGQTGTYASVDHIITSPRYEASLSTEEDADKRSQRAPGFKQGMKDTRYSPAPDNIGNLKGQTYLAAMLACYRQCHAVLKPGGLMVLVTKNFVRNRKEVDLAGDTIKLCLQAGFQFVERHHRKLTSHSFWHTIRIKKDPTAPLGGREDILIFREGG